MTTQQKIQSPRGTYQMFSNQLPGGQSVASVLYFVRHAGTPQAETDLGTMDFKLHTEQAPTEQQPLDLLERWCQTTFSSPCSFH